MNFGGYTTRPQNTKTPPTRTTPTMAMPRPPATLNSPAPRPTVPAPSDMSAVADLHPPADAVISPQCQTLPFAGPSEKRSVPCPGRYAWHKVSQLSNITRSTSRKAEATAHRPPPLYLPGRSSCRIVVHAVDRRRVVSRRHPTGFDRTAGGATAGDTASSDRSGSGRKITGSGKVVSGATSDKPIGSWATSNGATNSAMICDRQWGSRQWRATGCRTLGTGHTATETIECAMSGDIADTPYSDIPEGCVLFGH